MRFLGHIFKSKSHVFGGTSNLQLVLSHDVIEDSLYERVPKCASLSEEYTESRMVVGEKQKGYP